MSIELQAQAKAIYDEYGMTEAGMDALQSLIAESDTLTDEAIKMAARELLSQQIRHVRSETNKEVWRPKVFPRAMQEKVRERIQLLMLDRPMMSGSLLRAATKDDCLREAGKYQHKADGCGREARFYRLLAAKLREGQTVEQVYSEEQLRKLFVQATGGRDVPSPETAESGTE